MRWILEFNKFLMVERKSNIYEFGCLLITLKMEGWMDILSNIDREDLYLPDNERYGLEDEPHCTILYGIHKDVRDENVMNIFSKVSLEDLDIKVMGIDCFNNPEYDVLKMSVKSEKLNNLHDMASKLPHTSTYPDYKPHITIAYLKKGMGEKYTNLKYTTTIKDLDKLVYSKPDGSKIDVPII
jgi:hypothetical protein